MPETRRIWATTTIAHPAATILAGVLAGAVLAAFLTEVSLDGAAELWIGYHQAVSSAYTRALPPIGVLALMAAGWALAASWRNVPLRWLLFLATWCLLFGLAVTVAVHFPINAEVLSWRPADPPADWEDVRLRWMMAHGIRGVFALAAFVLLVLAASRREGPVPRPASMDETSTDEPGEVRGSESPA